MSAALEQAARAGRLARAELLLTEFERAFTHVCQAIEAEEATHG